MSACPRLLPKRPLLGSMFQIELSLMCVVAGFYFVAPLLAAIDTDLGPSPYLIWVAVTYTLTDAVELMIVGRLTDMTHSSRPPYVGIMLIL